MYQRRRSTAAGGEQSKLKGVAWAKSMNVVVSLKLRQLLILSRVVPLTWDSAEVTRPECSHNRLTWPRSGVSDGHFSLKDLGSGGNQSQHQQGCHNVGLKPHTSSQEGPMEELLKNDCKTWQAAPHMPAGPGPHTEAKRWGSSLYQAVPLGSTARGGPGGRTDAPLC